MTNSKTISEVILPMRIVNWIMGCGGAIEYPLGHSHIVLSLIYSSACVINYCFLTYLTMYFSNTIVSEHSRDDEKNDSTLFKIFFYLNIVVTFATIFMGWSRRNGVKLCIQSIKQVDELLRNLGISEGYDKMYKKQIYLVITVIAVITIVVIVDWKSAYFMCPRCTFGVKIILAMKYHYPISIMYINDFTFIAFTTCLRRKFEQLNELLTTMSGSSPLYPQYMKLIYSKIEVNKTKSIKHGQKTNDDIHIIKVAKQIHLDLVKICKHVNSIFGLHLLISMTIASILIIALFYNAYTTFIYLQNENNYDVIISSVNLLVFYILKILAVNHTCDTTSQEALKTGSIICELHEPATGKEFRAEIREFTLQLIQNPLRFTAFGFVTLDHTFIQDVVGTITTYLVILIQLRDMSEAQ